MPNSDRGTVELAGLSKRFGEVVAVDNLALTIGSGEFVALLGSSGCGKTTTLRMVGGFDVPDTGRVVIGGADITTAPPHRRDVNTVFQHYALFPHMSVADNVGYGLAQRGVPAEQRRSRVADSLAQVAMAPFASRRPAELSGGQQQRVALARALINRPAVLLLDEPLGALDRQLRQQMQVELKQIQTRLGMTFLYVTHDQEEALAMADRVAVMHEGRIEQMGTPTEVYDRPASAFVAGFVGLQNFFIGERREALTMQAGPWVIAAASAFDARPPGATDLTMTAAVRPESIRFLDGSPADSVNTAHGVVIAVQPLGDTLQYVIEAAGHEILVRHPRTAARGAAVGDSRWCAWDRSAVRLFAGGEAARQARLVQGRSRAEPEELT